MGSLAAYPPPPPFYKLYAEYREDAEESTGGAPLPPPPISGPYTLYGAPYDTEDRLPSLEEQGVRQLYTAGPDLDVKAELRALCRELVGEAVELADVLVQRPAQYARRIEEVGLLFKNIHHLLNSVRPHQARATLIHILEMQLETRRKALADIRQRRQEAKDLLQASVQGLHEEFEYMQNVETAEQANHVETK